MRLIRICSGGDIMAGFVNDTMYADNVDFSGSASPAPTVTTDGQLLIGSSVAPNLRVNNLTSSDSSIQITNGNGTIDLKSISSAHDLHITPFIVSAAGYANGANFTTVQAAINNANSVGGGAVYVQPGTYTENLTLYDGITIVGVDPLKSIITGVHTPPTSGIITFENITLTSATSIFSSAAAGSTNITLITCVCNVTNGYVFNLLNWTGTLFFYGCGATGTTDGGINNTGGSTVIINDSTVGVGTGAMTASGGTVTIQSSKLVCSATFGGAATVTSVGSYFSNTLTFGATATGTIYKGTFITGINPAVTQSSSNAVKLFQTTIDSSSNPVISGTGVGGVILGDIDYLSSSRTSNSFLTTFAKETGRISPYVVGSSGNFDSIQDAIDSLKTQFGPHTIYLQPGALYSESLDFTGFTFACNVIIRATSLYAQSTVDGAAIIGNITPPTSGQIFFENLNLIASSGDVFTSAAAGTAMIWLRNCDASTTSGGYLFGLLNWASPGKLVLENYRAAASGLANSIINNTGGCELNILDSTFVGTATGSSSSISGSTLIRNSIIYCPLNFVTGSSFSATGSTFNSSVTLSNNSTGTFEDCTFSTGATAALTMSSSASVNLLSSTVTSSNNPAIAGSGAGTLTYEDIIFTSNAAFAGTLTLATTSWQPYSRAIASTDGTKVGTAAFNSAQFTVDTSGFVSLKGGGFTWIDQGTSITLALNTGYYVTAATTQTLPASPAQGDTVKIVCDTAGAVVVTANTGQTIRLGTLASSSAGTFTSTARGDSLELFYRAATTQWIALNSVGTWLVA